MVRFLGGTGTPPLTLFNKSRWAILYKFFSEFCPFFFSFYPYLLVSCFGLVFCCVYVFPVFGFCVHKNVFYLFLVVFMLSILFNFVDKEKSRGEKVFILLISSLLSVLYLYSQYNCVILPV